LGGVFDLESEVEKRIEKIKQLDKQSNLKMLIEARDYAKKMAKLVSEFPNADYVTLQFYNKAKETIKLCSSLIKALKLSKKANSKVVEKHVEKVKKIILNINFLIQHEPQMRIGFLKPI